MTGYKPYTAPLFRLFFYWFDFSRVPLGSHLKLFLQRIFHPWEKQERRNKWGHETVTNMYLMCPYSTKSKHMTSIETKELFGVSFDQAFGIVTRDLGMDIVKLRDTIGDSLTEPEASKIQRGCDI